MKKINLFFAAALVLGMASCDDKSDLGVMQVNPQENIMSADGITLKYGDDLSGNTLDLNNYVDKNISVIDLVEAVDLPADATVKYEMQLSPYADFHDFRTLTVTDGAVKGNDWETAYLNMIGKSPLAQPNYVRFAVYAESAADLVRFGGQDFYYAAKEVSVTPVDLKLPIENAYYLVYGTEDENIGMVEMSHSARHPYDDPIFSYMLDITADQADKGLEWYVLPASAVSGGAHFGVSDVADPSDMSGNLMEDGAPGVITSAGKIKIEVNMLDLTYNVSYAFDYIYTPGPANGWGFENNMLLTTTDYLHYAGYVYVQEQYKLTGQPDWSPLNWGSNDGVNLVKDGDNITVPEDGLYYVEANLESLTFTQTQITRIGIIGAFNGWGSDVAMTPSDDFKTWTCDVDVPEAGEWKFRMNDGWDINLGGAADNLVQNGDNLTFSGAGTYTVTLNLGSLPYTCTVEAK